MKELALASGSMINQKYQMVLPAILLIKYILKYNIRLLKKKEKEISKNNTFSIKKKKKSKFLD